mmetsp:Transcript_75115/g.178540  ORF Transcript_75115/g.178540 Transcript_75115/m.178540 type:complete len:223 (+) Transcript_75115:2578-3246(+)
MGAQWAGHRSTRAGSSAAYLLISFRTCFSRAQQLLCIPVQDQILWTSIVCTCGQFHAAPGSVTLITIRAIAECASGIEDMAEAMWAPQLIASGESVAALGLLADIAPTFEGPSSPSPECRVRHARARTLHSLDLIHVGAFATATCCHCLAFVVSQHASTCTATLTQTCAAGFRCCAASLKLEGPARCIGQDDAIDFVQIHAAHLHLILASKHFASCNKLIWA